MMNRGGKRINDAARWMHSLIWFREAVGKQQKRNMVKEWNSLYPGAPVSLKGMRALDREEKRHGILGMV
jgi:hypothetical protein